MNLLNPPRLDKAQVRRSFNRSARGYDRSAVLQVEVLKRLLERLDYIKLDPRLILDLGCGTGQAIKPLRKRYRKASLLSLDLADEMLCVARQRYGLFDRKWLVNADMERLPIRDDCIDLVFSSLALQWSNDLPATFGEFSRVGRPGGLLMFTTFGVNTLSELRQAWASVDDRARVHQFLDMHDIGDMMMGAGLSQPVMDVEEIVVDYASVRELLADLKGIGATNAERTRSRGLLTASKMRALESAYRQVGFKNGRFRTTYEVVYGHAWFV
jgi:malonyl-CoA O-methyltransferase